MMKKKFWQYGQNFYFYLPMKNILLITLTIVLNLQGTVTSKTDVYLCNSKGGKKYHYSKNCRGLSNCDHEIIKVSLQKAKSLGKGLCGWE